MAGQLKSAVVVGASLAGLHAAEAMRNAGYDGPITLIGAEEHLPYDRPPLSKSVLTGVAAVETTTLRPMEHYQKLGIELRLGERVTSLDVDARTVCAGGDAITYGALVIATGAAARPLPRASDFANVHLLRTLDDAVRVRAAFDDMPRLVVIGGGFIGGEVAASARRRGIEVTVVDIDPLPMAAVLGKTLAQDYVHLHEDNGVRMLRGVGVAALRGAGRVEAVELTDGRVLEADLIVAGLGATPCVDWLDGSGVEVDNGVICGPDLSTNVPGVYAAGDVVRQRRRGNVATPVSSAHWNDAVRQGTVAGANAAGVGHNVDYSEPPFFWSMLYGCRIQVVGVCGGTPYAQEVLRLDDRFASGRSIALAHDNGNVSGVCGWNAGRQFNQLREWLVARQRDDQPTPLDEARSIIAGNSAVTAPSPVLR